MSQNQIISFENDEEDILFVSMEASPVPRKKLKRLKKAREVPRNDAKESTDVDDFMDYMKVNGLENNNDMSSNTSPKLNDEDEECIGLQSSCNPVDEEEREDDEKEADPISDSCKETKSLEATDNYIKNCVPEVCNDNEESQVPVGDDEHVMEATQDSHEAALSPLEKKKRIMESTEKSKPASSLLDVVEKRPRKKKRSEFDKIHAESQRLLRETRDVSFKSLPTTKKPISSVLEKIRLRKLQLEQKSRKGSARVSKESEDEDASSEDLLKDTCEMGSDDDEEKDECLQVDPETENKEDLEEANIRAPLVNDSGIPKTPDTHAETSLFEKDTVNDIAITVGEFRAPIEDTQLSSGEDLEQNHDDSTQDDEEVVSAQLSMKVDSHPDEEELFDEDDNKENVDPSPSKPTEANVYNKDASVKAFVDDEAEDEDEDALLGHGDDDDSDNESVDLEDIIATAEEEQPMDQSRRDELHRKWLEQQDAAATSDILLRLGRGQKQRRHQTRKTALLDEDDAIAFDNHEDDMIESDHNVGHHTSASEESKHDDDDFDMEPEAPLKTTLEGDDDDAFVSSDDEEVEERLMRERVLQDSEEQEMFLTPADDETSREVFGLIKKVNIAPNGKKPPKTTLVFHEILGSGGNSNSSSKSSFLGKTSSSLQTSHKQGSGSCRSYIFGRDDSNSRHAISKTEGQDDMDQKENENNLLSSTKRKFKSNNSGNNAAKCVNDSGKGPSLFEILRRTSEMDRTLQSRNANESIQNKPVNSMSHFAAFKSFTSIKTLKRTG